MSVGTPAPAPRVFALAVLLAGVTPWARAQTIGDLTQHPVQVHKDTAASASVTNAMENYRRFLQLQNTDPKLRAEAMRRLGDLNLDAGEMQRLEQEVTITDLQGAEAIRLYTTLLKAYPDYARNDQVLYQLSRAYETTGQPELALGTLDRIVQHYPGSRAASGSTVSSRRAVVFRQALCGGRTRLRSGDSARAFRVLPAEPVQARLVTLQAIPDARESAVFWRGARSGTRQPAARASRSRASGAATGSWSRTPCG